MTTHGPAAKLRNIISKPGIAIMPCCFDALSAKLVERAGFELTFMSGFAVSAARIGAPDTGLISYGEMLDQGRNICAAVDIPVLGDGDTGYGNALNVRRTVQGYAQVGFASIMIEDQVSPKRCGHTRGKQVVDRSEALTRIRAAVDARDEGADILVLARTDARGTHGLDEALFRARAFADLGADIVFVEAPLDEREMARIAESARVPVLANMLEQGKTPILPPRKLEELGFKIAAYPLTLLSASVRAMQRTLGALKEGRYPEDLTSFDALKDVVGFNAYYAEEARYGESPPK
jgi:2-methylisocitrate lyase-like PEP mutase family enzyme